MLLTNLMDEWIQFLGSKILDITQQWLKTVQMLSLLNPIAIVNRVFYVMQID